MKELNRTDRLTIAALAFALILLIGFITLRKPEVSYTRDIKSTLDLVVNSQDKISREELLSSLRNNENKYFAVDLRNPVDYQKNHIEGAMNIPIQDLLLRENLKRFKDLSEKKIAVVLYSSTQPEASNAWMILKQVGQNDIFILKEGFEMLTEDTKMGYPMHQDNEKPLYNFTEIMNQMGSSGTQVKPAQSEPVTLIKKAKKSAAEGGC